MTSKSALQLWREKLEFLRVQRAIASSASDKFQLDQEIEECKRHIQEIEAEKPTNGSFSSVIPSIPVRSAEIELKSERGIDYTKLRDLLKQQQWKEADEETGNVMLQVANRTSERTLREENIDNFPCEDLRTIDRLWVHYSKGRFGFSVQAKIYRELGGTRDYNEEIWNAFGDRVGWRVNNRLTSDVTFDLKAPQGHLPTVWEDGFGGNFWFKMFVGWHGWISSLASRLAKCNL